MSESKLPQDALRRKLEEFADSLKATAREMLDESKWKPGADRAYRYDKTARAETYESAAWNIAKILADTMPLRSAEQSEDSSAPIAEAFGDLYEAVFTLVADWAANRSEVHSVDKVCSAKERLTALGVVTPISARAALSKLNRAEQAQDGLDGIIKELREFADEVENGEYPIDTDSHKVLRTAADVLQRMDSIAHDRDYWYSRYEAAAKMHGQVLERIAELERMQKVGGSETSTDT